MDVFLCNVFPIMSQVTMTTATTILPVTVVYSGVSPITTTDMMTPTSVAPPTWVQHDLVLPPKMILGDKMKGSAGLTTMLQQKQLQSKMPSWAYANYAMGPPRVSFSFRVESPTDSYVLFWYLLWCVLSAFTFPHGCGDHHGGLNCWVSIITTF